MEGDDKPRGFRCKMMFDDLDTRRSDTGYEPDLKAMGVATLSMPDASVVNPVQPVVVETVDLQGSGLLMSSSGRTEKIIADSKKEPHQTNCTGKETTAVRPTAPGKDATAVRPTATGKETTAVRPTATGKDAAAVRPTATGKETTAVRPTATGKDATAVRPTATGKDAAAVRPTATGKETTAVRPTATGKETTAVRPTATRKETTAVRPTTTGKDTAVVRPTATGKETTAVRPTATGKDAAAVRPTATGKDAAAVRPTATGEDAVAVQPPVAGGYPALVGGKPDSTNYFNYIAFILVCFLAYVAAVEVHVIEAENGPIVMTITFMGYKQTANIKANGLYYVAYCDDFFEEAAMREKNQMQYFNISLVNGSCIFTILDFNGTQLILEIFLGGQANVSVKEKDYQIRDNGTFIFKAPHGAQEVDPETDVPLNKSTEIVTDTNEKESEVQNNGLPAWAIVLIVIAVILIVAILIAVFVWNHFKKKASHGAQEVNPEEGALMNTLNETVTGTNGADVSNGDVPNTGADVSNGDVPITGADVSNGDVPNTGAVADEAKNDSESILPETGIPRGLVGERVNFFS